MLDPELTVSYHLGQTDSGEYVLIAEAAGEQRIHSRHPTLESVDRAIAAVQQQAAELGGQVVQARRVS